MNFRNIIVIFWPIEPTFGAKSIILINFRHIWTHLCKKKRIFIFGWFWGFEGGGGIALTLDSFLAQALFFIQKS